MPRYFFHIEDDTYMPDLEGTEFPDLETARDQAITTVGAILGEGSDSAWAGHPWRMVVADNEGKILFRLDFTAQQFAIDETSTTADLGRRVGLLSEQTAHHAADMKLLVAGMRKQIDESREILARWEFPPTRLN